MTENAKDISSTEIDDVFGVVPGCSLFIYLFNDFHNSSGFCSYGLVVPLFYEMSIKLYHSLAL
jgi:hypothetical protein